MAATPTQTTTTQTHHVAASQQSAAFAALGLSAPLAGSAARVLDVHEGPNRAQRRQVEQQQRAALRGPYKAFYRALINEQSAAGVRRTERGGAATTAPKTAKAKETPLYLAPAQVASELGISTKTLRRWSEAGRPLGQFIAAKIGYGFKYLRDETVEQVIPLGGGLSTSVRLTPGTV